MISSVAPVTAGHAASRHPDRANRAPRARVGPVQQQEAAQMSFFNGVRNALVVSLAMWLVLIAVAVQYGRPAYHLGKQAVYKVQQFSDRVL
ncbi:hypothetical protein WDZ92_20325 [Nostoc sp. NIES-2111]